MGKIEEELKLYKELAMLTGDMCFKYDVKHDVMHILGGPAELSRYGTVTYNFHQTLESDMGNGLYHGLANYFIEALNKGIPDYFEKVIKIKLHSGDVCNYRVIGKKEFDDNWEYVGVIGKLISLDYDDGFGNDFAATSGKSEYEVSIGADLTYRNYKRSDSDNFFDDDFVVTNDVIMHESIIEERKYIDPNLLECALDILADTGNVGDAINKLLQQIGQKYSLDVISVQEYNSKYNNSSPCIQWHRKDNEEVAAKIERVPFDNFPDFEWKDSPIIAVNDMSMYMGSNAALLKLKEIGAKSVVIYKYEYMGEQAGWITFESHMRNINWNQYDISAFRLIAKFVSSYLINLKNYMELIEKEEREKTHDPVTGLPRYEVFTDKALKYVNKMQHGGLAMICFGLSNFERVNNKYGRIVGDRTLRYFAECLSSMEDRFIIGCRLSANVFIALVNLFDTRGNKLSVTTIDRVKAGFEDYCREKCPDANVLMNAGITFVPEHIESVDTYIARAKGAKDMAIEDGISCSFSY